jgi:hypothetical protein
MPVHLDPTPLSIQLFNMLSKPSVHVKRKERNVQHCANLRENDKRFEDLGFVGNDINLGCFKHSLNNFH